jgi:adenine-specific DNA-methyltransferase
MILNYLGSKVRMMSKLETVIKPILKNAVKRNNNRQVVFGDLFAGTGVVGAHFGKHPEVGKIVTNDQEIYSYIINRALHTVPYTAKLSKIISYLNNQTFLPGKRGLVTVNYSPIAGNDRKFFTVENAMRIDAMRIAIHKLWEKKVISYDELLFLLASLFTCVSRYSNNASCFRAYLKSFSARSRKRIELKPIHTQRRIAYNASVHLGDITLQAPVSKTFMHVVYLDPPYSCNHYGSYYGFYNYLAIYDGNRVPISGKAGVPTNYNKSMFGMRATARKAYIDLLRALRLKSWYVVMSYNEDGVLNKDELIAIFKLYGSITFFKCWNRKYRPNSFVEEPHVKDYTIVLDFSGKRGAVKELWMT